MGIDKEKIKETINQLLITHDALSDSFGEAERKAEDFLRDIFEELGWNWLKEATPQKKVKSAIKTGRVDYSLKKTGDLRSSFYIEVKRFSDKLINIDHIKQALDYGKNSGIRWIVLTNFKKWRIFNSDFFDDPDNAELFEFDIKDCIHNEESMKWLLLFSRNMGGIALDEYAKQHKKWKKKC